MSHFEKAFFVQLLAELTPAGKCDNVHICGRDGIGMAFCAGKPGGTCTGALYRVGMHRLDAGGVENYNDLV